jgi:hypothetical protein
MRCCDDSDTDDEAPWDQEAVATGEHGPVLVQAAVLDTPKRAAVQVIPVLMGNDDILQQSGPPRMVVAKECSGCCGDPSSNDDVSSKRNKEKLVEDFSKRVVAFAKTIIHFAIMEGLNERPGGMTALGMFEADLTSFEDDVNLI